MLNDSANNDLILSHSKSKLLNNNSLSVKVMFSLAQNFKLMVRMIRFQIEIEFDRSNDVI